MDFDERDRDLYLALHVGQSGDVDFYRGVCEGAESILELGVGAGRILSAIVAPIRVGLDSDPGMIDRARQVALGAELIVADMTSFDLGRRFDRILIPASALFGLPGPEAMIRCLHTCRSHLAPHGEIWFDAYGSDAFHAEADPSLSEDEAKEFEAHPPITLGGREVQVSESNRWSPDAQRFDVVYRFEIDGEQVEHRLTHHYLLSSQVYEIAEAAGLVVAGLYADFERSPFEPEAELMIGAFVAAD